ncbi:hybrid sensor histidine kinase/response regulator transcription factor [Bacteroides sp. UBA939]|uniref:hybrid sensor histidine kinase/response regulator transcription factor n=1 Tax=Bacteroides sp. UBA939 TaxID=1946092 RepID=UPI0025C3D143|nr:two-component regulator propeller domain-containing protein [Bacteroides sp. UBA939]
MRSCKLLLPLLYWLLLCTGSMAQPYTLQHLGVEDGLSNNYVRAIAQDKQGCIWVATELGLNRFDGRNFTTYKSNNSQLISDALNVLLYDEEENTLWIGGKFDGISALDCSTQQFRTYTLEDGINASNIVHLSHAADGGLWITPHYGNIVYYDKRNRTFTSLSDMGIRNLNISNWCSFDDGEEHLYIGHAQNGMSIINLKNKTVRKISYTAGNPQSLPGNSIYSIYKDHLQNIWVGTNRGLGLLNPKTEEFTVFRHEPDNPYSLIADHIYDIKEMNDGTLWIASDIGGISILDLHGITFQSPEKVRFHNIIADNSKHGVTSGNIRTLLQDSFGNIWIGNYSSGIDFISHSQPVFHILPYMTEKGNITKHKPVWGLCKDENGQIWLGGENEITLFKNNKPLKSINITKQLSRPYGQVFSIISDRQGTLLLGIYDDGLLKFNTRNERIERIPLDMADVDIITFFKDNDEIIWIGTEYGVYSYNNGTLRKEDEINRLLPDRSVYGILRDRQGKLWIGTYGGGIAVLDKDNKPVARLNKGTDFCSNAINSLHMDSQGGIWAATRNGIGYIKDTARPEEFESYGYEHGLEDTFVRSIQQDASGNIWLSTNDGISFWNKQEKEFDCYDYRDGIPMGNFIEGSACRAEDGTLYFGSLNGVCYFNPESLITEREVAPVQIIECRSLNNQIESRNEGTIIPTFAGSISLPYNRNSFRISFTVPDYSQSRQVEYAYMIEGLEKTWINTLGENLITFRNISPGEYTFKVKARLRNQEWDDSHIATLRIHIHPPLWLTWYAIVFYLLLLLLGAYLWLRFYKRKLMLENSLELEKKKSLNELELNNERLRFYTNITHELRTPLTLILGPLEDLVNDSNLPLSYGNKIKVIHSSALRLLNLINQILEFRKTETQNRKLTVAKGDLSSLVTEIGLRYKELNRNEKVKFHIHVQPSKVRLYFDADIISTILNNLLSNATKYTPEGEINLTMHPQNEEEGQYMEIRVSDTGYGIDADALPHIFDRYYQAKGKHQASGTGIGLALVKSLADLHEGTLQVESEIGKGTTFIFRLLTGNTYPNALHKEEKTERIPEEPEAEYPKEENNDIRPVILVVEDNDDIREYITTSFSANYHIITATNGKEGVEQAQEHIPDIVVSDIMMPVMDGIELCKRIKEDVSTSHIPVILLTAKDSIQDKEEGYESGADSYLTKPFSAKLLHSRILNLLESRRKLALMITNRTKELQPEQVQGSMQLSRLDEVFLNKFTAIVEENIDMDKLDMAFMREKMNMSHSTLYRKIKGLTGISGNEFIRKIRLKNSLRLLMEEGVNISEAAYTSGFNDLGYFRSCFKEEYGMVPSEYIRQQKA